MGKVKIEETVGSFGYDNFCKVYILMSDDGWGGWCAGHKFSQKQWKTRKGAENFAKKWGYQIVDKF